MQPAHEGLWDSLAIAIKYTVMFWRTGMTKSGRSGESLNPSTDLLWLSAIRMISVEGTNGM